MALDAGVTKLIRGDTITLEMVASLGGGFNFAGMMVRFTAKFDPADSMEDAIIALEGPSPDVELEPETGNDAHEVNAFERRAGLGKIGT